MNLRLTKNKGTMKKVLLFAMLMVAMTAKAQVTLVNGVYEKKIVEQYDSVKADILYLRALETLSDWAGSQQNSKIGIDVQDKDNGMVVYKGSYYMGYHKANFLCGWETTADFTIKIRCKDGKAQLTCQVPSMTFNWTGEHATETVPLGELLPEYNHKGQLRIKKAALKFAPQIPDTFDAILAAIAKKMKQEVDDF